ncbi:MAG: GrpB family protein [Pseudomonadota bacterium]
MDDIEVVEYDEAWPRLFEQEKRLLTKTLAGEEILEVAHFGSTAIPGLAAKPIIDILIAVPSVDIAKERFVSKLRAIDYVFWPDNPKHDRLFFVKGMPPFGDKRTHHVHVAERPSEMWSRLLFRDYLIEHAYEREAYANLKKGLASKFKDDREAYTRAKDNFVARIMQLSS